MILPEDLEEQLNKVTRLLRASQNTVVFTGAGVSVPSGIPDFRSASTGLWNRFDPMEVASLSAFSHRPEAFFNWLEPLVHQSIDAHPNPAHISLAGLQTSGYIKTIITQNIDGLHQKAGSTDVIELHGNLDNLICISCRRSYPLVDFRESWLLEHKFPACLYCSAYLKPDIVLYEEMLPEDAWEQAEFACNHADVIFIAGTSLEVMPASSLPLGGVHRGAKLVIMNLSPTPFDSMAESVLPLDVAIGVPELARRIIV